MTLTQDATTKLYIGHDIHKRSWSVCIRTDLFDHKSFSMPPEVDALYEYVSKNFKNYEVRLTYEAGCCGFSAARGFMNLGWEVTVVNPADVPHMDKQNYQKTDKIDARNLAKQLQNNTLTPIYIPTEDHEQFRSLLRQRHRVTKLLRKTKTDIKSMLLFHGVKIPSEYDNNNWSINFRAWLSSLKWSNICGASSMRYKLSQYDFVYKQYLDLGTELRAYARKHHKEDYYLLKSIPGIGGYLSAAILAECGDIRRFDNERQFSSYLGLVPGIYNSGGSETNLGITPRCNTILRPYLIESAWVAIRLDPEIQSYYRKNIGKNPKSIIVKIAHKMAKRILSVIKNKEPYKINNNENVDKNIKLPIEAIEAILNQEDD